jgi:GT2 family glycosyltransferase
MTKSICNLSSTRDECHASIYVIVPNKNGRLHLNYSLPSLFGTNYENYHVVLVDDGSTDDALAFVSAEYPNVTILTNAGKKGFAGAVNTGIKYALSSGATYIAIFNSDIEVLPEWLNMALPLFSQEQNVGLIGFMEIARSGEELIHDSTFDSTEVIHNDVRGMSGCLLLGTGAVFGKVGFFDEEFFMYGEDNDFFFRLNDSGFRLLETNIPVWHYGEGSSQHCKMLPTWLAYRNSLRFSIKHESFVRVMRTILSLINLGCNPFLRRSSDNPVIRRVRRYGPIVNIVLILGSCVWNVLHFRSTIKSRFAKVESH